MRTGDVHKQLLYALRRILRPMARLLIKAGIRFDEFADLARGVYVETAIRDGIELPFVPSRERIAAVTGVTRREVDRYIDNEGALPLADPTLMGIAVEVLQKWHSTPEYAGPYGIPLELQFDKPVDRCIRSLVALVMPNADAGAALEELLRTGAVVPSGNTHFRAVSRSFVMPDPASPQLLEHFGRTLSRFAATLEYNTNPRRPDKRLERRVAADRGLPPELVPEFEKFARSRAIDFLVELDNWLAPYVSEEAENSDRIETGVNVFLYADPLEVAPTSFSDASKAFGIK
ncbi:MAG: DUF6502 family protein [Steroidobacteraceae bacterium]